MESRPDRGTLAYSHDLAGNRTQKWSGATSEWCGHDGAGFPTKVERGASNLRRQFTPGPVKQDYLLLHGVQAGAELLRGTVANRWGTDA